MLVVGISPDGVEKQKAFADQHKLTYPLLCDVDGVATKAYGVTRGLLGLTPGMLVSSWLGLSPAFVHRTTARAGLDVPQLPLMMRSGVALPTHARFAHLFDAGRTTFIIDKGIVQDVHDSVINYAYASRLPLLFPSPST